jgi:hypothetical protein
MTRFRNLKQGEMRPFCAFLESCVDFATVSPHCGKTRFPDADLYRGEKICDGREAPFSGQSDNSLFLSRH